MDEDPRSSPAPPHEVTEILDSDEEDAQEELVTESPVVPARFRRKTDMGASVHARMMEDEANGVQEDEEQAEYDESGYRMEE